MKLQLFALVCALALAGCADHAARARLGIEDATVLKSGIGTSQDEAAGAVNAQWVDTYSSISNSRTAIAALQQRLDRLPADRHGYFQAKAQCWLDTARQARDDNDRWGFVEEAIGQAAALTLGVENGTVLSAANPALRTVSTVRPDLWKIVNTIKADPVIARCHQAQPLLACAEVGLMQAGHDAWIRSFSRAERRLPKIQDDLRQSAQIALQCQANLATAAPVIEPQATVLPRKITLRADSLFRFNGGDVAAILPAGRRQLDDVAARLKTASAVHELKITGYTDRLGTAAYNLRLSQQRARTVELYLRSHGVTVPVSARGMGSANQLVECRQTQREALRQCLGPNRRVEIEMVVAAP
ncbi:OmpA family protein [Paraburkholderia sp. BCC1886]|uniref:OmpA family protein n=1 Tax=Paraburkholderia sp. BCC1886 TaxID=2562670 RepID=UPI0011836C6E|nr:OmpA family protein [Paraburkholderia sp. BCC1886]